MLEASAVRATALALHCHRDRPEFLLTDADTKNADYREANSFAVKDIAPDALERKALPRVFPAMTEEVEPVCCVLWRLL